ncbi:hypothetical protein SCG7109_AS_00110 [Chlamydiales bacterium SCGC AG-110-M15]|nr:hypothetical protein SCG7109_AS_00110 [Chlamydiales bacterium SCGC AG-110-M15]
MLSPFPVQEDPKRLLVFMNPNSGSGTALKDFEAVKPYLNGYHIKAFIIHQVGEIKQRISENLQTGLKLHAVLFFMGDGPLHQEIEPLLGNEVPISIFPSGTGNGIVSSILDNAGVSLLHERKVQVLEMMKIFKEAHTSPFPLPERTIAESKKIFLLAWTAGVIAKCDAFGEQSWLLKRYPSVRKRLGSFRYDLGGVWELIKMQSHRARLTYRLASSQKEYLEEDDFLMTMLSNCKRIDKNVPVGSQGMSSKRLLLTYIKADEVSRWVFARILLGLGDGTLVSHPNVHRVEVDYARYEPLDKGNKVMLDGEAEQAGQVVEFSTTKNRIPVFTGDESVQRLVPQYKKNPLRYLMYMMMIFGIYKTWSKLNPRQRLVSLLKTLGRR